MPEANRYPPVGSTWKEIDRRVNRTIQVVRHDLANDRVRIYCPETEQLSWAKPERFNGKSGGYQQVAKSGPIRPAARRAAPAQRRGRRAARGR